MGGSEESDWYVIEDCSFCNDSPLDLISEGEPIIYKLIFKEEFAGKVDAQKVKQALGCLEDFFEVSNFESYKKDENNKGLTIKLSDIGVEDSRDGITDSLELNSVEIYESLKVTRSNYNARDQMGFLNEFYSGFLVSFDDALYDVLTNEDKKKDVLLVPLSSRRKNANNNA